jgi:hypothetical protein
MCGMKQKKTFCFFIIETKQKKTFKNAAPRLERLHGLGSTLVRCYRLSNPEMPTGIGSAYGFMDCSGEGRCWRMACKLSV